MEETTKAQFGFPPPLYIDMGILLSYDSAFFLDEKLGSVHPCG